VIPVALAPEPADFDSKARQRGLDAIAELVGEKPSHRRSGPKRAPVAGRRDAVPLDAFPPYWRDVLPEMRKAYGGLCAYLAMYIEPATGAPSVDHVVPRASSWQRVYEWSNYRLAAARINSKKRDLELVLDPFAIRPGLFALELVSFQVVPGPGVQRAGADAVGATIDLLGLNHFECCKQRGEYIESYEAGEIMLSYLERRAPFIAQELRRQGQLRPGDR
jgi:hypothetical protein